MRSNARSPAARWTTSNARSSTSASTPTADAPCSAGAPGAERSKQVAQLDAKDVLIPLVAGHRPAIADVHVEVLRQRGPHAELDIDDRLAGGALDHAFAGRIDGRYLAAQHRPADGFHDRADAPPAIAVGEVLHAEAVA